MWNALEASISEDQKTTFYSNLYRAFMYPNSMWESVNGAPRYFSPYDHEVHYQLGLCLERIGKADEARHHLDRFKQIETDLNRLVALLRLVVNHPRDPAPRREAGLICLRNGQPFRIKRTGYDHFASGDTGV